MNYKDELERIFSEKFKSFPPLESNKSNIVLYGAGSLGSMACDLLKRAGLESSVKYVADRVKKGKLKNLHIVSPEKIDNIDKENALFLVCIAKVSYNAIENYLKTLNIKNIMHFYTYAYIRFPQLLSNGWYCKELNSIEKSKVETICEHLAHDSYSIHHYLQFLWWKLKNREFIYEKYPVLSENKYFNAICMPPFTENEVFLDCGCHYGQTIDAFQKAVNNRYKNIYAVEPDQENLKICRNHFTDTRITYFPFAVSNTRNGKSFFNSGLGFASRLEAQGDITVETVCIDDLNIKPTIIKLHVEGEELNALNGAEKTIKNNLPILIISADHSSNGLYKIPEYILQMEFYKLFFYLSDYCGNTAIFYAIPNNRYNTCKRGEQ